MYYLEKKKTKQNQNKSKHKTEQNRRALDLTLRHCVVGGDKIHFKVEFLCFNCDKI